MMRTDQEAASVPAAVKSYVFDNRVALGAATSSTVPIQGVYGFREVNEAELRPWAFEHRHALWRSFYGAMPVPPTSSVPAARR